MLKNIDFSLPPLDIYFKLEKKILKLIELDIIYKKIKKNSWKKTIMKLEMYDWEDIPDETIFTLKILIKKLPSLSDERKKTILKEYINQFHKEMSRRIT